mmetsp:Transcript_57624/g.122553  ORF Transcript_57624/g.122553 Transcript_57624/m.122553 type:complete len:231 (+) Transcript_57624:1285-1977(+)
MIKVKNATTSSIGRTLRKIQLEHGINRGSVNHEPSTVARLVGEPRSHRTTKTEGESWRTNNIRREGFPILVVLHVGLLSKPPQKCRHPPQRLAIARRHVHEDGPDVLPALVADPVEEGVLHRFGSVLRPAVTDVRHAASVEPLQLVDARRNLEVGGDVVLQSVCVKVTPTHSGPLGAFIGVVFWTGTGDRIATIFHLPHDVVVSCHASIPKLFVHHIHGVSVEAVPARFF